MGKRERKTEKIMARRMGIMEEEEEEEEWRMEEEKRKSKGERK